MYQQSIQFFWPLTEQIPLDLDYTDCENPKLTIPTATGASGFTFATNGTTASWVTVNADISPTKLTVDVDDIIFKQKKEPTLFRRILYKIIGIKWEVK